MSPEVRGSTVSSPMVLRQFRFYVLTIYGNFSLIPMVLLIFLSPLWREENAESSLGRRLYVWYSGPGRNSVGELIYLPCGYLDDCSTSLTPPLLNHYQYLSEHEGVTNATGRSSKDFSAVIPHSVRIIYPLKGRNSECSKICFFFYLGLPHVIP